MSGLLMRVSWLYMSLKPIASTPGRSCECLAEVAPQPVRASGPPAGRLSRDEGLPVREILLLPQRGVPSPPCMKSSE